MKGAAMKWKGKKGERRRRNERVLFNQTRNTVKVGYPQNKNIFIIQLIAIRFPNNPFY